MKQPKSYIWTEMSRPIPKSKKRKIICFGMISLFIFQKEVINFVGQPIKFNFDFYDSKAK